MPRSYRSVEETVVTDAASNEEVPTKDNGANIAERVVYLIGGIILALLGLRFILSLLGANKTNAFAGLIYGLSHPFVAPFFGLFNYREQFGVSRVEVETLVAMAFWALLTWGIAYVVTISHRRTAQ